MLCTYRASLNPGSLSSLRTLTHISGNTEKIILSIQYICNLFFFFYWERRLAITGVFSHINLEAINLPFISFPR